MSWRKGSGDELAQRIVVLDEGTLGRRANLSSLASLGNLVTYDHTDPSDLSARLRDTQVVVTNKVPLDSASIREATNLSLIVVTASVADKIDLEAARDANVVVRAIHGYATDSVAQFTISLVLHLVCRLQYFMEHIRSGAYSRQPHFSHVADGFLGLAGRQVGILGLGCIGLRVAQIAEALGAKIAFYSPTGTRRHSAYKCVELSELLLTSDVVSVHVPKTSITENLIDATALRTMKRSAFLVNTGRGGVVNEDDLASALSGDQIAGAALDVFIDEPLKATSPLLDPMLTRKLVLTPHCAWGGDDAQTRLREMVYDIVSSHILRRPLRKHE